MDNWILKEVVENLKFRLETLKKMLEDEGFQAIYKAALKQEIVFIKEQLKEINDMMLEDVKVFEDAEADYRENRAYSRI